MQTHRNIDLDAALREAEDQFTRANPKSLAQHRAAAESMPGGNTRTVLHFSPFPITMARGEGARLRDIDGHDYVDFLSEFTAGVYGHSHPKIRAAVEAALDTGINLGAHNEVEAQFAAAVTQRFALDLVRFTNSGTEANLMALTAACAVTGRKKVMVFDGGYHGGVFLFRGGAAPINAPFDFVIARYNDIEGTRALVEQHGAELAAIILEPMLGGGGCIPADRSFLHALQEMAAQHGALFILDEVMTSRLAPGGLKAVHGLEPDLTTLGKYVGGGMSFGAFGGRRDIMERFDPRRAGAFQHAGTFNNNALTMRAGLVGLTEIYTKERAVALNAFGDALRERLNAIARRHGIGMQFTGIGSMIGVHMTGAPVRSAEDAARGDAKLRDLLFFDLLRRGVWIARRGFMALSVMLTEADGDILVAAVEDFAETHAPLFEAKA